MGHNLPLYKCEMGNSYVPFSLLGCQVPRAMGSHGCTIRTETKYKESQQKNSSPERMLRAVPSSERGLGKGWLSTQHWHLPCCGRRLHRRAELGTWRGRFLAPCSPCCSEGYIPAPIKSLLLCSGR